MNPSVTFRTGLQWLWLIPSIVLFALSLACLLPNRWEDEVPLPGLPTVTMPTVVWWLFTALTGYFVVAFSIVSTVTVSPKSGKIWRTTWLLLLLPIPAGVRSTGEVGMVRIGLEGLAYDSSGGVSPGCLTGALRLLMLRVLLGALGVLIYYLLDYDRPTESGTPTARIVFANRETWTIARGSEAHVEARATQAARLLGVRLGG